MSENAPARRRPRGTGTARGGRFLGENTSVKRVWVSNPSWPNHKSVFNSAGLEVREYAYYDAASHALDFDGLLASLSEARAGDVVLFHGCCHNPTGIDPTLEQWEQLAKLSVEKAGCRCLTSLTGLCPWSGRRCRRSACIRRRASGVDSRKLLFQELWSV